MLGPVLPHNRNRFNRLTTYQILMIPVSMACVFAVGALLIALRLPHWVPWSTIAVVFLSLAAMGALELRKTLLFRRDLQERRESGTDDRPSAQLQ